MKEIATVLSDGLNLRADTPRGRILDQLDHLQQVEVVCRPHPNWLLVRTLKGRASMQGYVLATFVRIERVPDDAPAEISLPPASRPAISRPRFEQTEPPIRPRPAEPALPPPDAAGRRSRFEVIMACASAAFGLALIVYGLLRHVP